MDSRTQQFIIDHANDDTHQLSLQISKYPLIDMHLAIRQIIGRQKIKNKIPSFYQNENILYPAQLSLEQSSSELTAKYKSSLCKGNVLIDLTGGFGIDCSFMSEHFAKTIYIERQVELCNLANHNFKVLKKNHIEVINTNTEEYMDIMENADWIFIDPARRDKSGNKVVFLSDCEPDVSKLAPQLLEKANKVMIKLSPMMDISAAQSDLPAASEIHIISIDNECKEVLIILEQTPSINVKINTINITKNGSQKFEFIQTEESIQEVSYAKTIENYLYEPNAAIMKSGAFKLIANTYSISKLQKNTHLYTSSNLIPDFPGRIFEVQKIWGNSKKELKQETDRVKKANISTRNYPISVNDLRKKLNIKEGGDTYLFACTNRDDSKIIIECTKHNE